MANELNGTRVAILATDGFEQVELIEPRKALDQAGAQTQVVSPAQGRVKGWNMTEWGETVPVDVPLEQARPEDFDALLLPGGVINPDKLRIIPQAMQFVRAFFEAGKPVAAICHGPWSLVEIGAVKGRTLTSWPSLQTDIRNAGGTWVDREVVTDNGLVTSRKPDDIPAFNRKMIEEFREGIHGAARRSAQPQSAHEPETQEGSPANRLGHSASARPYEPLSADERIAAPVSEHLGRGGQRPSELEAGAEQDARMGSEIHSTNAPRD